MNLPLHKCMYHSRVPQANLSQTRLSQASLSQKRLSQMRLSQTSLLLVLPFMLAILLSPATKASQAVLLVENKRIEATICPDSMNRIAVANDRITHIFGDEGTFESQNDENTGQVFLKPTMENGTKNLSLTFITEQGITQDLTLKPNAKSATTLIFKNLALALKTGQRLETYMGVQNPLTAGIVPEFSRENNFNPQHHLLTLLKQAVTGQLPVQETSFFDDGEISRSSPKGFELTHHQSYAAGLYSVYAFHVKNITNTAIEIQEKAFYQPGDLAITFQKPKVGSQPEIDSQPEVDTLPEPGAERIFPVGTETLLYVVRQAEDNTGGGNG
jgi:type-F conjugative transfer system secretin TraK